MYVGASCFDPQEDVHDVSSMELQLQQHLSLTNDNSSHLMQQALMINHHQNLVDLTYNEHEHEHDHHESSWADHIFDFTHSLHHQGFNANTATSSSSFPDHHQTPELVFNLLPSSVLPNSATISLADLPADPLFHLNLSPHNQHDIDACIGGGRHDNGKRKKPLTQERQRREQLNNKYQELKDLVPKSSKPDKASVVGDAIEYIRELVGTVDKLKKMVEKKRCDKSRERSRKRPKTEEEDVVVGQVPDLQSYNDGSSKSSWLQRKSNDIEVDVRVVDDDVTIKLVQPKKIDCLLFVSKVLDDLHLDLHHVAGGQIGDYYSFLFNTKIYEGSCVYAGAIANKLIEVMDCKFEGSGVSSGGRVSNV